MTPEKSEEVIGAILFGFDVKKKDLWAMSVEAKGPFESSVEFLSGKIENSG